MAPPLPIAVIGLGAMGLKHAACVTAHPGAKLAAVVDTNSAARAQHAWDCPSFAEADAVIGKAAAAIVAVPTAMHAAIASRLLRAGIACLVEKPFVATAAEAAQVMAAARAGKAVVQVGHIERFNPAVRALLALVDGPGVRAIAARRISGASARVTDIDVVLDLMIHDIDVVLALKRSPPVKISAFGNADHAVALLGFGDGSTASLTASRIAPALIRDLDVYLPHGMFHVDYVGRRLTETRRSGSGEPTTHVAELMVPPGDAMRGQLDAFLAAIAGAPKGVSAEEAVAAMDVAWQVRAALGL